VEVRTVALVFRMIMRLKNAQGQVLLDQNSVLFYPILWHIRLNVGTLIQIILYHMTLSCHYYSLVIAGALRLSCPKFFILSDPYMIVNTNSKIPFSVSSSFHLPLIETTVYRIHSCKILRLLLYVTSFERSPSAANTGSGTSRSTTVHSSVVLRLSDSPSHPALFTVVGEALLIIRINALYSWDRRSKLHLFPDGILAVDIQNHRSCSLNSVILDW